MPRSRQSDSPGRRLSTRGQTPVCGRTTAATRPQRARTWRLACSTPQSSWGARPGSNTTPIFRTATPRRLSRLPLRQSSATRRSGACPSEQRRDNHLRGRFTREALTRMSFNPNTPLDPGQVKDARGTRFGGRGLAIGGGGGGGVFVVFFLLVGGESHEFGSRLDSRKGGPSRTHAPPQGGAAGVRAN